MTSQGSSSFADPYLTKAVQDYQAQRWEECQDNLRWVLFHDANSYLGHYYQGSVYLKLKKFKDAEYELKTCIAIDNDKIEAYLKMVNLYDAIKDTNRVRQYLNRLQELAPKSREYLKLSADRFQKDKKFREASEVYGKIADEYNAHNHKEKAIPFLIKKAECLYLVYDCMGALEILKNIKEKDIKDKKNYLILLIKIHFALFNFQVTDKFFKEGEGIAEGKDDFQSLLIYKELLLEHHNTVIDLCHPFIAERENLLDNELKASLNRVVFCLACSYLATNKIEEFTTYILKCNPRLENIEYLLVFARYLFMEKKYLQALEYIERIEKQTTGYTPAILFKISLLKAQGQVVEADELQKKNQRIIDEYYKGIQKLEDFKREEAKRNNPERSKETEEVNIEQPISTISFSMNDFETMSIATNMFTPNTPTQTTTKEFRPQSSQIYTPPPNTPMSGKVKLIGKGGFGEVWEEWFNGEKKAVKYIFDENAIDEIREEVSRMIVLRHKNIVFLDGFFGNKMIMELEEGGSLKSLLKKKELELSLKFKMTMILGITEGLIYLHKKGIVHGDMKADNILLDKVYTGEEPYPTPKICDFGLSQIKMKDDEDVNVLGGTLPFIAPEALIRRTANLKSDVYTFGLTIYEIISRKTPYEGFKQDDLMEVKKENKLPEMEFEDETCKEEITNLINYCCKQDPNERPTMEDVEKEVKNILQTLDFD